MHPAAPREARALLTELGASPRLLRHVELVGEAADALLTALGERRVPIDDAFVRVGVILHDAGKVLHPRELDAAGGAHEPAGQALLLEHGVSPALARVCLSHARWHELEVSLEELTIALADKLWKGVRAVALEERFIDAVAAALGADRWDVFVALDTSFELIAAGGDARLARSRA
ncbi:MAG: HD domain-containing protein [Myxococcales bacterium]|nr:HD domain-containing protein [Myxococcales bacterium]